MKGVSLSLFLLSSHGGLHYLLADDIYMYYISCMKNILDLLQ